MRKIKIARSRQIILKEGYYEIRLEKPGVDAEILAVFYGCGEQKKDLAVNIVHAAPNTTSLTQVRGVLCGNSSSSFKGMVKVEKSAQKSNAYLDHDVLLCGDGVHNVSEPALEIEADDVRVTHGATSGRIPSSQLFYLQSRGLSSKQAEELIIEGFLNEVVSKISDDRIRGNVYKGLKGKHA